MARQKDNPLNLAAAVFAWGRNQGFSDKEIEDLVISSKKRDMAVQTGRISPKAAERLAAQRQGRPSSAKPVNKELGKRGIRRTDQESAKRFYNANPEFRENLNDDYINDENWAYGGEISLSGKVSDQSGFQSNFPNDNEIIKDPGNFASRSQIERGILNQLGVTNQSQRQAARQQLREAAIEAKAQGEPLSRAQAEALLAQLNKTAGSEYGVDYVGYANTGQYRLLDQLGSGQYVRSQGINPASIANAIYARNGAGELANQKSLASILAEADRRLVNQDVVDDNNLAAFLQRRTIDEINSLTGNRWGDTAIGRIGEISSLGGTGILSPEQSAVVSSLRKENLEDWVSGIPGNTPEVFTGPNLPLRESRVLQGPGLPGTSPFGGAGYVDALTGTVLGTPNNQLSPYPPAAPTRPDYAGASVGARSFVEQFAQPGPYADKSVTSTDITLQTSNLVNKFKQKFPQAIPNEITNIRRIAELDRLVTIANEKRQEAIALSKTPAFRNNPDPAVLAQIKFNEPYRVDGELYNRQVPQDGRVTTTSLLSKLGIKGDAELGRLAYALAALEGAATSPVKSKLKDDYFKRRQSTYRTIDEPSLYGPQLPGADKRPKMPRRGGIFFGESGGQFQADGGGLAAVSGTYGTGEINERGKEVRRNISAGFKDLTDPLAQEKTIALTRDDSQMKEGMAKTPQMKLKRGNYGMLSGEEVERVNMGYLLDTQRKWSQRPRRGERTIRPMSEDEFNTRIKNIKRMKDETNQINQEGLQMRQKAINDKYLYGVTAKGKRIKNTYGPAFPFASEEGTPRSAGVLPAWQGPAEAPVQGVRQQKYNYGRELVEPRNQQLKGGDVQLPLDIRYVRRR